MCNRFHRDRPRRRWLALSGAHILLSVLLVFAGMTGAAAERTTSDEARASGVVAVNSRVSGDGERTRFVTDLTDSVPVRAFALADPYRVIVDLPEVAFRLPPAQGQRGRGLVSAYRYGLFAPGKSRIVLDVTKPVIIDRAFVLKPQDGQPARLVVDLVRTDRATFERRTAMAHAQSGWPRSNAAAKSSRLIDRIEPPRERDRNRRPLVVIDPGHGGVDPGAIGRTGTREKDVVLAFSETLKASLEASGGVDVVMTRDDDRYIALAERVQFARERQASLFISVHADSFRSSGIRGATIYTLSEKASDAEAAALAEKENRADLVAGLEIVEEQDAVTDILLDLVRRETKNLSVAFAKTMVEELRPTIRLNKNPHRFAGFRVLRAHDVPSVLFELGYLSNPRDEQKLLDPEWRSRTADRVARAVRRFVRPQIAGAYQGGE